MEQTNAPCGSTRAFVTFFLEDCQRNPQIGDQMGKPDPCAARLKHSFQVTVKSKV